MTDLRTPITIPRFNRMMYCLLLPLYTAEADGQFFSVRSMVRHALAALTVPRTVLRTRTFDVVILTRHKKFIYLVFYCVHPLLHLVNTPR